MRLHGEGHDRRTTNESSRAKNETRDSEYREAFMWRLFNHELRVGCGVYSNLVILQVLASPTHATYCFDYVLDVHKECNAVFRSSRSIHRGRLTLSSCHVAHVAYPTCTYMRDATMTWVMRPKLPMARTNRILERLCA